MTRPKTIFDASQKGQRAYSLPKRAPSLAKFVPPAALRRRSPLPLPEVSELDLTRHFSTLAHRNMGIDTHFYPLGSCTMKLNPRANEVAAALPGFARVHPFAPDPLAQGCLQVIYELTRDLARLAGMTTGSLAPCAGAQGEFVGLQMITAYHHARGDTARTEILVPDNAHGTNPASATMAGLKTVSIRSKPDGDLDLDHLRSLVSARTAGLMLTNPSTLGLFCPSIVEAAKIVHGSGGLLYYDGANLNAILNIVKPGEMGFDVMHMNLHKTFSTPHGGGGPGSGPVFCNERLASFLPLPHIVKDGDQYCTRWHEKTTIGQISTFFGNFGIYLRAYLYIRLHGDFGLRKIAEVAVLNANYLKERLSGLFTIPYQQRCMHEFVVQADKYLDKGIRAMDIAKRLLDYGIHAPTVYFPLIVKECMLIEPTEGESKATLDRFIEVMEKIVQEIKDTPDLVKTAPHTMSRTRLDEVLAVKEPILTAFPRLK